MKKKKKKNIEELVDDTNAIIQGDKTIQSVNTGGKSTTDQFVKNTRQTGSVKGAYSGMGGIFGMGAVGMSSESLMKAAFKEKILEILEDNHQLAQAATVSSQQPEQDLKSLLIDFPSIYRAADFFGYALTQETLDSDTMFKLINFMLKKFDLSTLSPEQKQQIAATLNGK